MNHLELSTATRWGLNALILVGMALTLHLGRSIFIPTLLAVLLAALLWPAVQWLYRPGIPVPGLALERRWPWLVPALWRVRIPWPIACMAAVTVLVLVTLGITLAFSLAVPRLLEALPSDAHRSQELYTRFRVRLERISPFPLDRHYLPENAEDSAVVKYVRGALNPNNPQFVVNMLLEVGSVGGSWLWHWILIIFILLFLLLEGRMLLRRLVQVFGPSLEAQTRAVCALQDMAYQIRVYVIWRTTINVALAVVLGGIYQLAGLSQAWSWAFITAILLYVPYMGPILAGIPPVFDAFVSCDSPWVSVGVLGIYVMLITVEGYLIVPLVMGRSMDLNATTVMLSCLFWELVWGWPGLFLAMPLMATVKTVCAHVPEWQAWGNLMDSNDDPEEIERTIPLTPSLRERNRGSASLPAGEEDRP